MATNAAGSASLPILIGPSAGELVVKATGGPAAADDAAGLCARPWVMKHTVPGLGIVEPTLSG